MSGSMTHASAQVDPKVVVVAGMGPAGIVSAMEALKKGYHVIVYEPKEFFTRGQRLNIDLLSFEYLREHLPQKFKEEKKESSEEYQFFKKIEKDYSTGRGIRVNDLQYLLEAALRATAENSKQPAAQGQRQSENLEIRRGKEHEIVGFDLTKGKNVLLVKRGEKAESIPFDYFVAADGAKRLMSKKINEGLVTIDSPTQITYAPLEVQTRRVPHGTVAFRAKEPFKQVLVNTVAKRDFDETTLQKILQELKALGWEEEVLPNTLMFNNAASDQFHFAGEIPEAILQIEDENKRALKLEAWGKVLMKWLYGVKDPQIMLELDYENTDDKQKNEKARTENRLVTTAFELRMYYTDTPCLSLNPPGYYLSVGDATMNANFFFGHGANDAMADGRQFGRCLPLAYEALPFNVRKFNEDKNLAISDIVLKMKSREATEDKLITEKLNERMMLFVGTKEGASQANKLIEMATPLIAYNSKLKKKITQFEREIALIRANQGGEPDPLYKETLELSEQINIALNKKIKQDIKVSKKELPKIKEQLFKINSKLSEMISRDVQQRDKVETERKLLISKAIWLESWINRQTELDLKNEQEQKNKRQQKSKGEKEPMSEFTEKLSKETSFLATYQSKLRLSEKKPEPPYMSNKTKTTDKRNPKK